MIDAENKDKWDDAQQVRGWATRLLALWLTPTSAPYTLSVPRCPQALCTCSGLWKTSFTWWAML